MSRLLRGAMGCAIVLTILLGTAGVASADGPTILGAGSTWSQVAIMQWQADVHSLGLSVNYQGVGSTQGRALFAGGTVDFGVSEIPYQPEDNKPKRGFSYLPIVAGGTSMIYNLKTPSGQQIRSVTLSATNIALIFTGKITNWDDKRLKADGNPGLPNVPIRLVVRSDGSGTSAQFTRYMHETVPNVWNPFTKACGVSTPPDGISFYPYGRSGCLPNAIGQRGSDGVANYVANPGLGVGAIGYVEAAYALLKNLPVIGVKNQAGNYALPTAQNVATALQHATLNNDSTQELSNVYTAPEAFAYPISSYSYMIVPTDGLDPSKGNVLGQFINYFACTGQQSAQRLGYSPMPPKLVQFALSAESKVPGAPPPPAITPQACPNPTVTGAFKLGSSVAADNVFPGTDLGQKTFAQTGSNGGSGGGGGSNSGGSGGYSSGGPTVGPSVGPASGGGAGGGTVTTVNGQTLPPGVTLLTQDSLKPLKAAALQEIQGMDSPGRTALLIGAVIVLAVVLAPLALRFRK